MNYSFENGAIVVCGKLYENVKYDVSNKKFGATFNGNGCFTKYLLPNKPNFDCGKCNFLVLSYNGKVQNILLDKTVIMKGRMQTVKIDLKPAILEIELFLSPNQEGIFSSFRLINPSDDDVLELRLLGYGFKSENCTDCYCIEDESNAFASDNAFSYYKENGAICFSLTATRPEFHSVFIVGDAKNHIKHLIENFYIIRNELDEEIKKIKLPENLNECEKALFYSSYYCALENYKDFGSFQGFMAGCEYIFPPRTYYRDSYFTVLPMYNGHKEKVRSQIITLAKGIKADGSCPSAVCCDFAEWWGDHYDSPSFLAIMLYDYIKNTKDKEIANILIDDKNVFEKSVMAMKHLSNYSDETHLLYKDGRFNKRDWADEVNRYGYVTYDELLYARAIYSISQIYKILGNEKQSNLYYEEFENIKKSINEILWNDELGYYVNFSNDDYIETNLSIDTVFAVLFHIADEKRAKILLKNMEKMLESKNNGTPEDFGCMCVYPFYSNIDSAYNKSSQSYNYHNGANWPYLTAMYAYAKRKYGMEYEYLLTGWFEYNLKNNNYTPIEYFSPYCADGSLLQAWSADTAFVLDEETSVDFWD